MPGGDLRNQFELVLAWRLGHRGQRTRVALLIVVVGEVSAVGRGSWSADGAATECDGGLGVRPRGVAWEVEEPWHGGADIPAAKVGTRIGNEALADGADAVLAEAVSAAAGETGPVAGDSRGVCAAGLYCH